MEVTKEKVLESMNTYCTERKYGSANLTDGFKEKFSDFFVKRYEGKEVEEADLLADLHFNLDTAFSATVDINQSLTSQFATKENDFKNQIEELKKKLGGNPNPPTPPTPPTLEIPKEIKEQLEELKRFKDDEAKKNKYNAIIELAKKGVRKDLHASFEKFAQGTSVDLQKEDKEQADALVTRFQEIFKDSIGDIKPLAPQQTRKRDSEVMSSIPRIKV